MAGGAVGAQLLADRPFPNAFKRMDRRPVEWVGSSYAPDAPRPRRIRHHEPKFLPERRRVERDHPFQPNLGQPSYGGRIPHRAGMPERGQKAEGERVPGMRPQLPLGRPGPVQLRKDGGADGTARG